MTSLFVILETITDHASFNSHIAITCPIVPETETEIVAIKALIIDAESEKTFKELFDSIYAWVDGREAEYNVDPAVRQAISNTSRSLYWKFHYGDAFKGTFRGQKIELFCNSVRYEN